MIDPLVLDSQLAHSQVDFFFKEKGEKSGSAFLYEIFSFLYSSVKTKNLYIVDKIRHSRTPLWPFGNTDVHFLLPFSVILQPKTTNRLLKKIVSCSPIIQSYLDMKSSWPEQTHFFFFFIIKPPLHRLSSLRGGASDIKKMFDGFSL